MMPIYLCLHYNRTKQDSKNYKNEWEIRGTDITHTEKATDITGGNEQTKDIQGFYIVSQTTF